MITEIFSEKGLTGDGWKLKLANPTRIVLKQSGDDLLITFEDKPKASITKKITILGKEVTTLSFGRPIEGIRVAEGKITVMLDNWPDFSFEYGKKNDEA